MGWIECNGMERDRVVELACSHGRKRSYSVLDLLCGARGFVSGFFSFCGLSSGFGPSLSRRRSSAIRKVGSCASYGLDEVQKYGITPLLCTLLAAPFVMVEFCFFF